MYEHCPRCNRPSAVEQAEAIVEVLTNETTSLEAIAIAAGMEMWDALPDGRYVCGKCDSLWVIHEGSLVLAVDGSCSRCCGFECPGRDGPCTNQ